MSQDRSDTDVLSQLALLDAESNVRREELLRIAAELPATVSRRALMRAIAADLRRERITSLEERAHKLGAKLTVPMVLFLLPAMFVILGGSSFLHLIRSFKAI